MQPKTDSAYEGILMYLIARAYVFRSQRRKKTNYFSWVKLQIIKIWELSKRREMKSFLGLAGYYCKICTTVWGHTHALMSTIGKKKSNILGKLKKKNQLMPSQGTSCCWHLVNLCISLIFNSLLIVRLILFTTNSPLSTMLIKCFFLLIQTCKIPFLKITIVLILWEFGLVWFYKFLSLIFLLHSPKTHIPGW